jgi:Flp pilus assembly pilin Flp
VWKSRGNTSALIAFQYTPEAVRAEGLAEVRALGTIVSKLVSFVDGENGATAIEYAMIAVFIAMVLVAVLPSIGDKLGAIFASVSDALS